MQEYEHRRLDSTTSEFRLLRIEKSPDETAQICITLRHAQLDEEDDRFYALSYAWGDESPTYEIVIDDGITKGTYRVRQNLFDYLGTARRLKYDWTAEWIWIDQICIDQNHHTERCHQVGQMGQLYSTAKATISWPGQMRAHEDLQWRQDHTDPSSILTTLEHDPTEEDPGKLTGTLQLRHDQLVDLAERPYWSRTWIIQEIVLARKRHILILDGLHTIGHVLYMIDRLEKDPSDDPIIQGRLVYFSSRLKLMIADIQRVTEFKRVRITWSLAVLQGIGTECSIPFDRVYAVMGLLEKRWRFQPDYSITEKDLLRNVLQSELAIQMEFHDEDSTYNSLNLILVAWSQLNFSPVCPSARIVAKGASMTIEEDGRISGMIGKGREPEYNVRLAFRELGIAIPGESSVASTARMIYLATKLWLRQELDGPHGLASSALQSGREQ